MSVLHILERNPSAQIAQVVNRRIGNNRPQQEKIEVRRNPFDLLAG